MKTPAPRVFTVVCCMTVLFCPITEQQAAGTDIAPLRHRDVSALAFSSSGEFLATAGKAGIRIWRVDSGKLVQQLAGHTMHHASHPARIACTTGLAFLDDHVLLSCGLDGNILRWNPVSGEMIGAICPPWVLGDSRHPLSLRRVGVDAMALSTDRKLLAACVYGTVHIWNLDDDKLVRALGTERLQMEELDVAALVPEEKRENSTAWVELYLTHCLQIHKDRDGRLPSRILRWRCAAPLLGGLHTVAISSPSADSDDAPKVIAAGAHTTYAWDLDSGKLAFEILGGSYLAYSPHISRIATGSRFYPLRLWSANTGKMLRSSPERTGNLIFSPDGSSLFVVDDGYIWRWNVASWTRGVRYPEESPGGAPNLLAMSEDGKLLAATWTGWDAARIRIWRGISDAGDE